VLTAGGNGVTVRWVGRQPEAKAVGQGRSAVAAMLDRRRSKITKQGVSMASNEGGEPGWQLPDASELGAASERFRPVPAREANLAAADEVAIRPAFALRWQTRSGTHLTDRGRFLAVSVVLSPVLFGVVAAILLIVSGHGIVGNLVVSDAAAGGLVVGLLPYGIAKCGSRPRLMYRDSETADWTLAVSASQLALERALPDGSRARVEIDRGCRRLGCGLRCLARNDTQRRAGDRQAIQHHGRRPPCDLGSCPGSCREGRPRGRRSLLVTRQCPFSRRVGCPSRGCGVSGIRPARSRGGR
jgi:hypothetical protein